MSTRSELILRHQGNQDQDGGALCDDGLNLLPFND